MRHRVAFDAAGDGVGPLALGTVLLEAVVANSRLHIVAVDPDERKVDQLRRRLDDQDLRAEIKKEMETTGGWENWYRHVGHDWDRVVIGQSNHKDYQELDGQSVAAMAKAKKRWSTT